MFCGIQKIWVQICFDFKKKSKTRQSKHIYWTQQKQFWGEALKKGFSEFKTIVGLQYNFFFCFQSTCTNPKVSQKRGGDVWTEKILFGIHGISCHIICISLSFLFMPCQFISVIIMWLWFEFSIHFISFACAFHSNPQHPISFQSIPLHSFHFIPFPTHYISWWCSFHFNSLHLHFYFHVHILFTMLFGSSAFWL